MNSKEKELHKRITQNVVPSATQGLVLRVRKSGRIVADIEVGKTHKYYDLASLTKIIFANTALMLLYDRGDLKLTDKIETTLPWLKVRNIIIRQLLTHTAGLTWWKPIYKKLPLTKTVNERRELLKKILNSEKPKKQKKAVYSDLDYFVLSFYLEQKMSKPMQDIWLEVQEELQLKASGLHFCADNKPLKARKLYAPTEGCPWRKKVLRGEVHDDNTWALGGVSTHAGLFGSMDDVDEWFARMRSSYLGRGPLKSSTVRTFWKRALPRTRGDWALGYMMPSDKSSSGQYFSRDSIGHTGFTGTSLWYDPKIDFSVILLSNRVHPTRENAEFVKWRPIIHDWCWELYNGS